MALELQNKWDELIGQSVPVSKLTTDLKWVELTNKLADTIIKNCNSSCLVLDIGAGEGSFYFLIKKICKLYVAIDPSSIMVKRFRNKANNYICLGCGEDLPYQSGIFDVAILNSALDHCFNPVSVIAEAHRILKPGGKIFLLLTNEGAWYKNLFTKHNLLRKSNSREHLFHFIPDGIRTLLEKNDFSYIRFKSFDFIRAPVFIEDILFKICPRIILRYLFRITDVFFGNIFNDKGGSFICSAVK